MKQHITREQWKELNKVEVEKFTIDMKWGKYGDIVYWEFISIGIMIEFLEVDLYDISRGIKGCEYKGDWSVVCNELFKEKELIDALWEATKYKLKR